MRRVHEILGVKPLGRVCRPAPRSAADAAPAPLASVPAYTIPPVSPPPQTPIAGASQAQHGGTAAIITCHNYGRFLGQCIDSLLAQTMPFESIVIVDDASDDDTAAIAQAPHYTARGVRYIRGEWRDFTRARLAGLASVRRPRFLLFVDADNWLPPGFHALLRAPMENPKLGVAYAAIRYIDEAGADLRQAAWATPCSSAATM